MSTDDLTCPFCGDTGFDAIGLKAHFFRYCAVFDSIESPEQEQERRNGQKYSSI